MRRILTCTLAFLLLVLAVQLAPVAILLAQGDTTVVAVPGAAFPLTDLLQKLGAIFAPVIGSGLLWLLNKRTTLLQHWPNPLKTAAYLIMATVGGYIGARFGLDMSNVGAFVASALQALAGLGIFKFGLNTGKTSTSRS